MPSRRWVVVALAAVAVAGAACDTGSAPGDGPTDDGAAAEDRPGTTVAGVTVRVPDGWRAVSADAADGVVASEQWRPHGSDVTGLQLVIGCDASGVDGLVEGTLSTPRTPLVLTEALELTPPPDVSGLDATRRLELTFGLGRDDDARTLRTSGLYGEAGDAIVLVELTTPVPDHDDEVASEVLGSVFADAEELSASCADGG